MDEFYYGEYPPTTKIAVLPDPDVTGQRQPYITIRVVGLTEQKAFKLIPRLKG